MVETKSINIKKEKSQSFWRGVLSRFRKDKKAVVSFYILLIIIISCIVVPFISPYSMETTNMSDEKRDIAPNSEHILGTDDIGRDIFTRLFYGGRISLGIALVVVFIECVIGIVLGSLAGYYGGIIDTIIMRLSEIFMSFPFMIFCITAVSVLGTGVKTLIIVLSILSWPSIARIVRGQILTLREMEYMEACEALGISDSKRIFKHLLPNVLAYIIVYATLGMASVILTETSLSFLGLGISPPTPTWGNMMQDARSTLVMQQKWWYWIPPGICIFLSVMCFNLLGDGLRDAVDPKMKR